jgi:hypothetical protein
VVLLTYYGPNYVGGGVEFGVKSIEDAISKLQICIKVNWLVEQKKQTNKNTCCSEAN